MSGVIMEDKFNDVVIIGISGEITMTTVSSIDNACKKYINSDISVLALDMRDVQFIDSFGISRLIKQSRAFNANGIEFILINLNDNIYQIFRIATFDKLFTIMTKDEFKEKYHIG